jgi:hypothetical protein
MANVSFALVLNVHQPAWNLEDLLQHREWKAKEILERVREAMSLAVGEWNALPQPLVRLFTPIPKPHSRPLEASCDTGQSIPRPGWLF